MEDQVKRILKLLGPMLADTSENPELVLFEVLERLKMGTAEFDGHQKQLNVLEEALNTMKENN